MAAHPNAKTFRNGAGAIVPIRRPAAAPKKAAPPKVNPIDAAVTSQLAGQSKPYEGMLADRQKQYDADRTDQIGIGDQIQSQLLGIQKTLATANNDALGLAAQRGTASADQMQRNMDFLSSVLGNYVTDDGSGLRNAASQQGVVATADAAGNAAGVRTLGVGSNNQLAAQRGAQEMAVGERAKALLDARIADQRAIQNEIARIKATAPALRYKMQQDAADRVRADKELGLSQAQVNEQVRSNKAQENLGYYQTNVGAASDASKGAAANAGRYGFGIDKKYDDAIAALYGTVAPGKIADPAHPGKYIENPNHRWRETIKQLANAGLSGGQAVLLASKWMPDRLTIHGGDSPSTIYKALKDGSLGFKLSDAVAKQVFQQAGLDWNKRTSSKKPSKGHGLTLPAGTINAGKPVGSTGVNHGGANVVTGGSASKPGNLKLPAKYGNLAN